MTNYMSKKESDQVKHESNTVKDFEIKTKQMTQRKFNYLKELMKHEVKTKIIVEEENQPNLDRMAEAIWKLLRK